MKYDIYSEYKATRKPMPEELRSQIEPVKELLRKMNIKILEKEVLTDKYGIAVQKGNTELLNKLNTALAELDTTDFEEMMNTAISVQPLSE